MSDLLNINFNLLKILDALLEHSHVTAAGEQVGLSQAATSNALKQLRQHLNDPLLVRGHGSSMTLTDYAKSIRSDVKQVLSQIDQLFNPGKPFVACMSQRVFHIALSDYLSFIIIPKLAEKLNRLAPKARLIVHHLNDLNDAKCLENHDYDLVLGSFSNAPMHLEREKLYEDHPTFVAKKSHPIFNIPSQQLSLKAITHYPLIMVAFSDDPSNNYLDQLLKSAGCDKTVSILVPHALIALQALKKGQFITHTVKRLAEPMAKQLGLKLLSTPMELRKPKYCQPYTAYQYWHKTMTTDPAHSWLRSLVKSCSI